MSLDKKFLRSIRPIFFLWKLSPLEGSGWLENEVTIQTVYTHNLVFENGISSKPIKTRTKTLKLEHPVPELSDFNLGHIENFVSGYFQFWEAVASVLTEMKLSLFFFFFQFWEATASVLTKIKLSLLLFFIFFLFSETRASVLPCTILPATFEQVELSMDYPP